MPAGIHGITIQRSKKDKFSNNQSYLDGISLIPGTTDDGSTVVAAGGAYGLFVDLEGTAKTEAELVNRYRDMALHHTCDSAIEDIVNEAIVVDEEKAPPVEIVLDNLDKIGFPPAIKDKIKIEFDNIMNLLSFTSQGHDIFRIWYIDGRVYYYPVISPEHPETGILELRSIDPRKIRKIREIKKERDPNTGVIVQKVTKEYYIYNDRPLTVNTASPANDFTTVGFRIAKDNIIYVTSGITDKNNLMVLSHLHKAIKPLNMLRIMEDACLVYRIARAPERRIFYIDVGNLPRVKAEQYMRDLMVKHKNRLIYDAMTGEIKDDRKYMTLLEDYWLPRRGDGRGTQIDTLPAGQNLNQIEDIFMFKDNLYEALQVPRGRKNADQMFSLGKPETISRDEIKFDKFVKRLRRRFSMLFDKCLRLQLVLKKVINDEDWSQINSLITYNFRQDNFFAELKESEILANRLQLVQLVDPVVGTYVSVGWVRRNIFKQTEDEEKMMDMEIQSEMIRYPQVYARIMGQPEEEEGGDEPSNKNGGNKKPKSKQKSK